ncbi:MAG: hypothetical protein RI897_607 [Verrucomicrobiota bacterium]
MFGADEIEGADIVGDTVEAECGIASADFDGLVGRGVHTAFERDCAAEFLELVGGDPGIGDFAVVVEEADESGAGAGIGNTMAEEVLDEVHFMGEEVAGVAGAVGVVTAPVPEVAFIPGDGGGGAEPAGPVDGLLDFARVGALPLVVVTVPPPVGVLGRERLEATGTDERDGAEGIAGDEFFGLKGAGGLAGVVSELEHHVALFESRAHELGFG